MAEIRLMQRILASNDALAEKQLSLLNRHRVLSINIMSGPGAGKTSLIERTVQEFKDRYRLWVIEGDIQGGSGCAPGGGAGCGLYPAQHSGRLPS